MPIVDSDKIESSSVSEASSVDNHPIVKEIIKEYGMESPRRAPHINNLIRSHKVSKMEITAYHKVKKME